MSTDKQPLPKGHWLKFREKWAHGNGEWQWRFLDYPMDEEEARGDMTEHGDRYYWSDKFRGMEWEIHQAAPEKVVLGVIMREQSRMNLALQRVRILQSSALRVPE